MRHLIERIVGRGSGRGVALCCFGLAALVSGMRWMISAPIDAAGASAGWASRGTGGEVSAPERLEEAPVVWPDSPLEGPQAKRFLRGALRDLVDRLEEIRGYQATVRRRERVGGRWLNEQTLLMKVRHRPASVYMKDIGVEEGCEIIYVEGLRDGKLVSHLGGGLVGMLMPPVELDPRSPLAMSQSRFPITEAGVLPLARAMLADAERDLDDPRASVRLDRVAVDGRSYYRSIQRREEPSEERPFVRVEMHYEPETLLPRAFIFYDRSESGPDGEPTLGGRYEIESFDPGVALDDLDFEPSNPDYQFR